MDASSEGVPCPASAAADPLSTQWLRVARAAHPGNPAKAGRVAARMAVRANTTPTDFAGRGVLASAHAGRLDDVQLILRCPLLLPIAVHARDGDGCTLLHLVAGPWFPVRPPLVQWWIPARMRPPTLNARKPAWPSTHTAPASLALVRRLLACGADANARDRYGRTPLEYAAKAGTVAVLRALVGGGAELRLHSPAALSPFRAAAEPRRRPREARAERLQVRWALRRCTASTCCLIRRRVSGDARVLWDWDCCQVTCKYLRATGCDAGSAFKHACWNPTFPQVLLEHPDLVALHWDGLQSAGVGHAAPGTLALHLAQLPLDAMCTAVQELLSTAAEVQARRWGRLREAWVSAVVRTTWLGRASRTGR